VEAERQAGKTQDARKEHQERWSTGFSRRGVLERARWQTATNTTNRLTNHKRTPVREGAQSYSRCLAASKVIQEVGAGARRS